jgi:hypothetical protein
MEAKQSENKLPKRKEKYGSKTKQKEKLRTEKKRKNGCKIFA